MTRWLTIAICALLALGAAACGEEETGGGGGGGDLSGSIRIDGSSTVQPFAEAAAELFNEENPDVKITVGGAGTGDGFEKFCRGELDIADASRAIEDEETQACQKKSIAPKEIQVASDGVSVVSSKQLKVDCLKTSEVKEVFATGSKVQNLSEVKKGLPSTKLSLFTPGAESGTFEFFTEEVNETEEEQRTQGVQTSANDNVLVTGVSGEPGGFGYFGFSFYDQNKEKLNLVGLDAGSGCVKPSTKTIQDGSYKPLSRPLFMYPSTKALARPEVKAFMDFVVNRYDEIARVAKVVPMAAQDAQKSKTELGAQ